MSAMETHGCDLSHMNTCTHTEEENYHSLFSHGSSASMPWSRQCSPEHQSLPASTSTYFSTLRYFWSSTHWPLRLLLDLWACCRDYWWSWATHSILLQIWKPSALLAHIGSSPYMPGWHHHWELCHAACPHARCRAMKLYCNLSALTTSLQCCHEIWHKILNQDLPLLTSALLFSHGDSITYNHKISPCLASLGCMACGEHDILKHACNCVSRLLHLHLTGNHLSLTG